MGPRQGQCLRITTPNHAGQSFLGEKRRDWQKEKEQVLCLHFVLPHEAKGKGKAKHTQGKRCTCERNMRKVPLRLPRTQRNGLFSWDREICQAGARNLGTWYHSVTHIPCSSVSPLARFFGLYGYGPKKICCASSPAGMVAQDRSGRLDAGAAFVRGGGGASSIFRIWWPEEFIGKRAVLPPSKRNGQLSVFPILFGTSRKDGFWCNRYL